MGAENKARKRAEEIEYEGADVNMFIPLEKKKKKRLILLLDVSIL